MDNEKTLEERLAALEIKQDALVNLLVKITKQNIELVDIVEAILTRVEALECDPNA